MKIRANYIRDAAHPTIRIVHSSSIIIPMFHLPALAGSMSTSFRPIILEGTTLTDFLQRLLTNNVGILREKGVLTSALTDASARIVDLLDIILLEENKAAVLGKALQEDQLLGYFNSRIFFMDQIKSSLSPTPFFTKTWVGVNAANNLESAGWPIPDQDSISTQESRAGVQYTWWTRPGKVPVFHTAFLPSVVPGAPSTSSGDAKLFDQARIILGIPAAPNEIRSDYTPYEVNLGWTVSPTKGCYPGQEVLARQVTYDKVVKTLVPIFSNVPLEKGQLLFSDDKRIGEVTTSYSQSDTHLALSVVRRPFNEAGRLLEVKTPEHRFEVEVAEFTDDYAASPE